MHPWFIGAFVLQLLQASVPAGVVFHGARDDRRVALTDRGRDAFRTATGVHAAAVVKAFHKNDSDLADTVYSGVPARLVGRSQEIEVGPMSGRSNVLFWLERRGFAADDELVDRIFRRAKGSATVLTEPELMIEISKWKSGKVEEVEK